jgi:bifunctional UDP-N-acetylglucosamine pyrophosphorylase/glucosamine-1-phosphate N-acetyltransferase
MLKVVILAAGKSTRMKTDTPKVLHEVAGVPILRWVLNAAQSLNPEQIIVIVGHGAEAVRAEFKDEPRIAFVTQEPQLGTGHAVQQAASELGNYKGDVCVLCGDVPLVSRETLAHLAQCHRDAMAAATVLTTVLDDPGSYGRIVRSALGGVIGIVEQRDLKPGQDEIREINSGTYFFKSADLLAKLEKLTNQNAQREYYLTDVIHLLVGDKKPVAAWCCEDWHEVLGINTRRELATCDRLARARIVEALWASGVSVFEPVCIEAGVNIGRDTIVHPHSVIRAGVQIGERCEIGPFAHLRQGTVVGKDCKVGAFVETKNAKIGDESKAGHLAYLGDVTLGKHVNVGAGTIVANYDGKKKHKTQIGDKAFIGCGTVLVAPVKVGKNAQTGANTVVPKNKDVPDDTIVVGIPARVLKKKA